jgi:hypothetical protein
MTKPMMLKNGGRGDPRDLHDRHEAGAHSSTDLVERTCSSDDGHAEEVYGVLDGRDLRDRVSQCGACLHMDPLVSYKEV